MTKHDESALQQMRWTEEEKRSVWNKGQVIPGFASQIWRRDHNGEIMQYSEYKNKASDYGWLIVDLRNGFNVVENEHNSLQPLSVKYLDQV